MTTTVTQMHSALILREISTAPALQVTLEMAESVQVAQYAK